MQAKPHRVSTILSTTLWLALAGTSDVAAQMPPVVPEEIIAHLLEEKIVVMQELRAEGALEGALTVAYVIFEPPRDRVYELLSQTERQVEFRPELKAVANSKFKRRFLYHR